MDANRGEITLHEQLVQLSCSAHTFNKDNNLIEVQCIKKIVQLPIFLQLSQFDVVLPFQFWLSDGGSKTGIVLSCQEEKNYNIGMASPSPNQLDSSMWSIVLKVQGWTHLSQRARPVPSEKLASMQFLYFILETLFSLINLYALSIW